jgi:RNA polymerase sporulation-specific sigma factor
MVNYSDCSDSILLELSAKGDRAAEEQLSLRYARLVRICTRPYFLAGGDSEDLIQEGMLGLLYAIREYRNDKNTSFHTFARRCIKSRVISAVRSASRLKHRPLNNGVSLELIHSDETSAQALFSFYQNTPEEQVLASESADEFLDTFNRCLSKLEREILRLYLDGLSYTEISETVLRPDRTTDYKTIDNAVQRIRRKLANFLESGDYS